MGVRPTLAVTIVAALLLAAVPAAAASAKAKAPAEKPKPVLEEWPRWPYPVSCGEFAFDPVAVLSSPVGVEYGSKPSEQALRAVLEDPSLDWLGYGWGWRLAGEDADSAQFLRGEPGTGLHSIAVAIKDGRWQWAGSTSSCSLTSRVYGDYYAIDWVPADDRPLGPNTRRVRVRLTGGPCRGNLQISDRAHFVFRQLGKRLLMSAWIDPLPPGPATCPGVVEPVLTVKLPGRLGQRKLFDGGTYPPVAWTQTPL